MSWCFAIINNRLAEIYFDKKRGKPKIFGHCYVKKEEYKTKQEHTWIAKDTKKFIFTYRNGQYKPNQPSRFQILKKTAGSWRGDDWPKTAAKRKRIEIQASIRRKKVWIKQ